MPVRYEIDGEAGLVRIELSAAVTSAEILDYYSVLAAEAAIGRGLAILADCRRVTSVPAFAELSSIAAGRRRPPADLYPTRVGVVVAAGWLFGIIRQFAALIERTGLIVVPFYCAEEAERWLVATGDVSAVSVASGPRFGAEWPVW